MKIAIGSDHHGIGIRISIQEYLRHGGHEVFEFGPRLDDGQAVDYPDVAADVAGRVGRLSCDRGILICGTGIGMSIAANKFAGVRAAPIFNEHCSEMSRRHNDLNVICLSGDMLDRETMCRLIDLWLETPFEGGRHQKRLEKIEHSQNAIACH